MADPKLTVALEARLDKFEKDLQQAGVIAERAVANIEDKFAKSNPTLGAFAGGFLGAFSAEALLRMAQKALDLNKAIAEIGDTAKTTGIELGKLQEIRFALMSGGVGGAEALSGLTEMAHLLGNAAREENSLTKILDANNIKYKDRNGELISSEKLLSIVAELIRNAARETDKIDIAKAFGLGKDFIRPLENGAAALAQAGEEGRKFGVILDKEAIEKARMFRDQWDEALTRWSTSIQSNLSAGLPAISTFMERSTNVLSVVDEWANKLLPILKFINQFNPVAIGVDALTTPSSGGPTKLTVTPSPRGKTTVVPSKDKDSGSDSDAFDKQLEQQRKRIALMEADTATVGLNSEARERARTVAVLEEAAIKANTAAGMENTAVTDAQRVKINEMADAALAAAGKLRQAQELVSAFKELGSVFSEAFKGMVLEGKKLDEVLKNLANRVASKAFDKLFDSLLGGLGGNFARGLFSGGGGASIAGARATGGPVNAGSLYMVGERGPELFRPRIPGSIIANGGGGGANVSVNIHNNAGADVSAGSARSDGNGGLTMDIFVQKVKSEIAGDIASRRGSVTGAMGNTFGLKPALINR